MGVDIVSVLVCTRNRPGSLLRTVRSLLSDGGKSAEVQGCPANEGGTFELIVIDQSSNSETEQALAPFRPDSRLRYVRSRAQGKGAALNEGLRLARGEIIACTDDDCEAPAGWVAGMARVMDEQPTAAVVFCNVLAPACDWSAGYIPTYARRHSRLVRSLVATCAGHGMGAGMALRRDVLLGLGGFDETFGPGARFGSGDDWDISHRVLLKGWHVFETADLSILHHGFRTLAEGREHMRRDWLAIGAVCAKPLRAGHLSAAVLAFWYFSMYGLWPIVCELVWRRRLRGRSQIVGFIQGFTRGLRTPVDRKTLLFRHAAVPGIS